MPKSSKTRFFPPRMLLLITLVVLTVIVLVNKGSSLFTKEVPKVPEQVPSTTFVQELELPAVSKTSKISLEQTLFQKRTQRKFFDKSINLKQLSQLLWSLQGVTADWGERTAPSAKFVYPLEVYVVALNVEDVNNGLYKYIPGDLKPIHKLGLIKEASLSEEILSAAKQTSVKNAPVVFIISGDFQKMTKAFGEPADHNVYLEAGHATQNLYLQVKTLGLGTVAITGFDDPLTYKLIGSPANERVIYVIPVGYPDET